MSHASKAVAPNKVPAVAGDTHVSVRMGGCRTAAWENGLGRVPFFAPPLPLQTKLAVNEPGDMYEQEADRVAEQVMRMPEPSVQRATWACGGEAGADEECEACKAQEPGQQAKVQRAANGAVPGQAAPESVHQVLRSPGQPLDAAARAFMEPRFGRDFGDVRVHVGPEAAASAAAVGARAYAVGKDVVFGAGKYAPQSLPGRNLIAHELTHVLQQTNGAGDHSLMRSQVLDSYVDMKRRYLKGETVFDVADGGLIITGNGNWEPSEEWQGEGRPRCPGSEYHITLNKQNRFLDDEYGTCAFEMGKEVSSQWTNLPVGKYYLTFSLADWDPNCVFKATVHGEQQAGLTGETCTKLPPGPLEVLHDALSLAGMVPYLGAIPDAIDSGIYVIEGDWTNAGLSAAAVIPIFGDAAAAVRIEAKAVVRVEGGVVKKLGKQEIANGLKAAKAVRRRAAPAYIQGSARCG